MLQYRNYTVTQSRTTGEWIATPTQQNRNTDRLRAATKRHLKEQIDDASPQWANPWDLPKVVR